MTIQAFITGSGVQLPGNVITNEDLAERLNIAPAQVFKSTGIARPFKAGFGEPIAMASRERRLNIAQPFKAGFGEPIAMASRERRLNIARAFQGRVRRADRDGVA
jgi:hypothetical protein